MFAIPMYVVVFHVAEGDDEPTRLEWRVSQDDLDAFCKILRWNGIDNYRVELAV